MGKHPFFRLNLGIWTPQINCLGKTSPVLRVSTHIYGVSQEIYGKTYFHIFAGVSKDIGGRNMFIFPLNLGM